MERRWNLLASLYRVGEYLEGNCLHLPNGLDFGVAVGHYAGKVGDGSKNPPVVLTLCFYANGLDGHHSNSRVPDSTRVTAIAAAANNGRSGYSNHLTCLDGIQYPWSFRDQRAQVAELLRWSAENEN